MLATLLASLAVALGPGETAAPVELIWDASPDCPGPVEVEDQIERFLSIPLDAVEPAQVVGHVIAHGPRFELELDIRSLGIVEHHEVSAATCARLGEVAGLLIASVVEPLVFTPDAIDQAPRVPQRPTRRATAVRTSETPTPSASVETPLDPVPAPDWDLVATPVGERDIDSARTPARRWSGLLGVSGGTMLNLLPKPAGGVQLGALAERGALRLGGSLGSWFASGFRASDQPAIGGRVWAGSGSLMVCGVPGYRSIRVPLCAEAGAGFMRGRGLGIDQPKTKVLPWGWLGAEATLEWWFRDRVAIGVGVAVIGSVVRPAFTIEGSTASYVAPPVAARAELGVVTRFGPKRRSNGLARR